MTKTDLEKSLEKEILLSLSKVIILYSRFPNSLVNVMVLLSNIIFAFNAQSENNKVGMARALELLKDFDDEILYR